MTRRREWWDMLTDEVMRAEGQSEWDLRLCVASGYAEKGTCSGSFEALVIHLTHELISVT